MSHIKARKRLLSRAYVAKFEMRVPAGFALLAWIAFASSQAPSEKVANANYLSALENEVLREINLARTQPAAYAVLINDIKRYYKGELLERPGEPTILTEEGISAVEEAAGFLRRVKPVPALASSPGLSRAAKDHVRDQGPRGAIGHRSRDGSEIEGRINRYGRWQKAFGENISYGESTARMIVTAWIIDDGVRDRGHRKNIFTPDFRAAGIACGDHAAFKSICVVDFAAGYQEGR